ncbi:mannose-1-phosphate guanylyltransferase/mannose-6-phosphate isomerase [Bosea sp. (in: a-proteobacteria)]|uniref:mannose-1-phosphate guanylyltransferase/mannose-6-phosphate isomerase n=1 Tax=Bosea sp. (in: a-proteobacteria) TaxID=1871050 RepID=UPI002DDD5A96|nr:mannose-1-phosphate guanylyltransferase/mannose-6-phosphate isomerase [Bosea sp. (in: a-proteobacteria)]HEV2511173.1 mannose-1-phosphate guanylyltransferase/mannose-6-phosphate isomerase [Bosea sp. (in: a-proteobacteria)]
MTAKIVPLVMAGGSGTRLWPLSRDTMPKQFIALLDDGLSTFQATLQRLMDPAFGAPIVITNNDFRFIVAEQMLALGIKGEIVLEPERRDSAAAIAVGTVMAGKRDPEAVCVALASDHVVSDAAAFRGDCKRATRLAATGLIMTLGIKPTHPSTAYGYLAPGEALSEPGASRLSRFVEKPKLDVAEKYVAEGYLWNSGNFLFSAKTMRDELSRHAPAVLSAAEAAVDKATRDLDFLRLDPESFGKATKISIDYAVMERTAHAGMLSASFDWSDVGSWDSIHAIKPQDGDGNVLEGPAVALDTHRSLIRSEDVLTTVVGLDDVVVVSTRDAVLVASMAAAGKVKTLVEQMKAEGRPEASEHLRIYRPWGWYQRIDIGARFQVKHIHVKEGGQLSLQKHFHRAEHWVVVSGTAEVTLDDTVRFVHENESVYLPIGCTHRLKNPGKIGLELIEVQVGSYTGEDDIVRIEDIYARS